MSLLKVEKESQAVALAAALLTIRALESAINKNGYAIWVVSGGSTPMQAYKIIAEQHKDKLDWRKVWIVLGDERCVPLKDPASNWEQINLALLRYVNIPESQKLRPAYELSAEEAAKLYEKELNLLPKNEVGETSIDLLWLGLGEDGHTLSLFPGRVLRSAEKAVIAVHNAPKAPPDRISLTLNALKNVKTCLVLATGSKKSEILSRALSGDSSLPITQVIKVIEANDGQVEWLTDQETIS